jgi:hypothetical protein
MVTCRRWTLNIHRTEHVQGVVKVLQKEKCMKITVVVLELLVEIDYRYNMQEKRESW